MKGGSDEQAQREAVPKRQPLWALSQPLAQWAAFYSAGVWHVAQYDRLSGGRDEVFLIFYIVCVLLTWLVYGRRSSAKNKRSMPDTSYQATTVCIRQGIRSQFIPGAGVMS